MSDADTNFRMERIEKLLQELRYEIERGLMEREINETLTFQFIFPRSQSIPNGVVFCEFQTRPTFDYAFSPELRQPKLRVVK